MTASTASTATGAVIFSDLVGFTEFNDVRGDDEAVVLLDRHLALMECAVESVAGARVVKELGDGLLVWSPGAPDGMRIAVDFVSRLAEERRTNDFPLAVRVGLHYGDVQARGDDVVGQTVNIAARIVDLAGPGEILVSEQTVQACNDPDGVSLAPVGPASVKGVADAVWLHRASAAQPSTACCE